VTILCQTPMKKSNFNEPTGDRKRSTEGLCLEGLRVLAQPGELDGILAGQGTKPEDLASDFMADRSPERSSLQTALNIVCRGAVDKSMPGKYCVKPGREKVL